MDGRCHKRLKRRQLLNAEFGDDDEARFNQRIEDMLVDGVSVFVD